MGWDPGLLMRATILIGWFFYLATKGWDNPSMLPVRQDFQMQPACETARAELKRAGLWVSEKCIFDGVPRWDWKGEKK